MELNRVEAAAPGRICTEGEAGQETNSLDEKRGEAGCAAIEGGLELEKGGGGREKAVLDEGAYLADGLVSDGGGGGAKAAGECVASGAVGKAEWGRGGTELFEERSDGEALQGGLREARLVEKVIVGGGGGRLHSPSYALRQRDGFGAESDKGEEKCAVGVVTGIRHGPPY